MPASQNPSALIEAEISRDGSISFARFMELALYAPGAGYYERQRDIGKRGDFFTSVSAGPLFGELLAFQFARWLDREGTSDTLQIIEAGAHDGTLAADILGWLQRRRPDLFSRIEYWLVEPSQQHRAWQRETLREFESNIKWTHDLASLGQGKATRIIFGNELLDAMPVHRCLWNAAAKRWDECRVAGGSGAFVWQRAAAPPALVAALPAVSAELAFVLPDGYVLEHCPAAVEWWTQAACALGQGTLLTLDYGLAEEELFRPERTGGTLRTYSKHYADASLLEHPGECDITAHINFHAIESAGQSAGLKTEQFISQDRFLGQILVQTQGNPVLFDPWTPARLRQFNTLAHQMGHSFRVLVQSRGF
jgi:SAM-dependent MidA family methyltransferase